MQDLNKKKEGFEQKNLINGRKKKFDAPLRLIEDGFSRL
jgi:hypothetical protein